LMDELYRREMRQSLCDAASAWPHVGRDAQARDRLRRARGRRQ
jgi:hypothetical protein